MSSLNNSYAFVIGIAEYEFINRLPTTVTKDAEDIYRLLIDPNYCSYKPENVKLLVNKDATKLAIKQEFENLSSLCDEDSTVFFYISSHGGFVETGNLAGAYLLPVDTDFVSEETLSKTAISGVEFTEFIRSLKSRKIVMFFDCCHSGGIGQPKNVSGAAEVKTGLPETYYESLKEGVGRVIIASSRSTEFSYILPNSQNSLFTKYLIEGIKGSAPGPGGVIRIFDLFNYLQPKVTAEHPGQHPIFKAEIEDNFPVSLYLGGSANANVPSRTSSDSFAYDVFISYRQKDPDKQWVRKTLVPRLKNEGLRVLVDYLDFRIGYTLISEMERAVEQSRYTLSVLSPLYLESNFTDLENILADHLGLENSQRRLLAVMREPCQPRLGMRARLWLDMTDNEEFDVNIQRLIYELKQPPKL